MSTWNNRKSFSVGNHFPFLWETLCGNLPFQVDAVRGLDGSNQFLIAPTSIAQPWRAMVFLFYNDNGLYQCEFCKTSLQLASLCHELKGFTYQCFTRCHRGWSQEPFSQFGGHCMKKKERKYYLLEGDTRINFQFSVFGIDIR